MTLQYKEGCLIQALKSGEVQAIGHQANCFHTMNSGVAKAIRLAFPGAYFADTSLTVKGDRSKLGTFSIYQAYPHELSGEPGLIYNLYGQYNYGYDAAGYTDYAALEQALRAMREDLLTGNNLRRVGFPRIGAGLGGGDWTYIAGMVDAIFTDFEVTVYIK